MCTQAKIGRHFLQMHAAHFFPKLFVYLLQFWPWQITLVANASVVMTHCCHHIESDYTVRGGDILFHDVHGPTKDSLIVRHTGPANDISSALVMTIRLVAVQLIQQS